jgi:hypothetical protein
VDSYRSFSANEKDLVRTDNQDIIWLGTTINAHRNNITAGTNTTINGNGITATRPGTQSNRVYMNQNDGFRVTVQDGANEVNVLSLNPANGKLIINPAYVEGL